MGDEPLFLWVIEGGALPLPILGAILGDALASRLKLAVCGIAPTLARFCLQRVVFVPIHHGS
jgi:hypothetical protein